MARDVVLKFTANVTSLRAGMLSASASVKDFEGQVRQVATTSSETQRMAGKAMLGLGAAVAAGLALAVRSAVQFEQRMMNVATISGDVEKNFGAAGDAILDMSGRLGVSANELAEGLYDVASSGFQGADGMEILEQAATAAQAGLSTTAVAARAITGALNAYGLSVSEASDVSDIFFQTVNFGIVTFEELADSVGAFMSTSAALNIALDEASAGLATITLAGVPAEEAATALNATMTALLKPSGELAATLGALGYESAQAAVDANGLGGTLQMLRGATGDNTAAFAALFPNVRAMKGALAITADEGRTWNRVAGEITDKSGRAGAAAEALAIQQKSLGGQMKIAKEQIVALAIGIGQSLLPVLRPVVGLVQDITGGFAALGSGAQTGAAAVGVLGAGVLTLGGGFLLLAPKVAEAVKWFRALQVTAPLLAKSLRLVTLSMGGIGILLTGAAIALAVYGNQKRKAKERTDEFVQALKDEKAGVEDSIDGLIRRRILEGDLDKTATNLGISIETVARAMNGEKDALDEVNAAADRRLSQIAAYISGGGSLDNAISTERSGLVRLKGEIASTNTERKAATVEMGRQEGVERDVASATGSHADATAELTIELTDAQKAMEGAIRAASDLGSVYSTALSDIQSAERDAARASADAIRDRSRAHGAAMDKRHRAERKALDAEKVTGEAAQAAHDQRVEALDARQEAEKESADATVEAEGRRASAIEDTATTSRLTMEQYRLATEKNTEETRAWMRNLAVVSARGGEEFVGVLAELGPEAAGVVADVATASDAEFAKFKTTMVAGSKAAVDATQAEFNLLPGPIAEAGRLAGKGFTDKLLTEFRLGIIDIEEIIARVTGLRDEMIPVVGTPGAYRPRGGGPTATLNMAEGHVAQIAPAGSWRVWAEPETGGEAYIPLGLSKRGRSTALVAQVARQFGYGLVAMAEGGTWGVPARSGGSSSADAARDFDRLARILERSARRGPVKVEAVFNEKVEPLHVARQIAWAVA